MLRDTKQYNLAIGFNKYIFVLKQYRKSHINDNRGVQIRSHTNFGDANVRFICPNNDAHILQDFLEGLPDGAKLELKMVT